MKRWLVLSVLALPLAGCVLPPALSIASLALDAGSFAATGKSATDHVLSGIVGEDCRMLGVLEGEICREELEFETLVASLEPLRPLPEVAPDQAQPAPEKQLVEARRAPVRLLAYEPPLAERVATSETVAPVQLASAAISTGQPPLAGLEFLSAGLPAASADARDATPTDSTLEQPLSVLLAEVPDDSSELSEVRNSEQSQRRIDPAAEQLAALAPLPREAPEQTRGLVYGDDGRVLGVAYAFQNPLSDMDGNRDSLSEIAIIDR